MTKLPQPAFFVARRSGVPIQIDRKRKPRPGDWVAVQRDGKTVAERYREQSGIIGVIRKIMRILF